MVVALRYAGLVEEASYGITPIPPARIHIDQSATSLDVPSDPEITYSGGFGRGLRVSRPGYYAPQGNIVYAADINTIGFFLKWALGGYKSTTPTNLVTNPDFETNTTGWTTTATTTIAVSAAQKKVGANSMLVTYGNSVAFASYAMTLSAAAHSAYLWLYIPTAYTGAGIRVAFDSFVGATGTLFKDADMTIRDFWQRVDVPNVTLVGGDVAGFLLINGQGAAPTLGNTFYIDDVHVHLAATETLHEIYTSEDSILPSFVAHLGKDSFEHVFSGCIINSLQIKVEDNWVEVTADIMAQKDSKVTIKAQSALLLPAPYPMAFHEVTATINAVDQSALVRNLTINIQNNVNADMGRSIGSRFPRRGVAGERSVTVDGELFYTDTSQLERFWGGASAPAVTGPTEFVLAIRFDSGVDGEMTLAFPKARYTSVSTQPSGRNPLVQPFSVRALMGAHTLADAVTAISSEVLASLSNKQPAIVS